MQPIEFNGFPIHSFNKVRAVALVALSFAMIDYSLAGRCAFAEVTADAAQNGPAQSAIESAPIQKQTNGDASKSEVASSKSVKKDSPVKPSEEDILKQQQQEALVAKDLEKLDPELHPHPDSAAYTANHPLEGSATYIEVSARFGDTVHRLTKGALEQDQKYLETAKAVDHYRTGFQKTLRATKDALNYMYPYRGFSMSMEGSSVILDKEQKISNLCMAELAKQRYWDEMHPKVMAQIMQVTMGLGMDNPEQSKAAVDKGLAGLTKLVGKDAAESTVAELTQWNKQLSVPNNVYEQQTWDVESTERIRTSALATAADGDALIKYVYDSVKKYQHGKVACATASMVEANLAAATVLSGNPLISLGAEAASTAFVMSTGGPEENKILKELYFGRRLELRRKRISDEAELALTNYQKAVLTRNGAQLAMSEIVLSEIVGPDRIAGVLERDPITDFTVNAPIELAKKDVKAQPGLKSKLMRRPAGTSGKGIVLRPAQAGKKTIASSKT